MAKERVSAVERHVEKGVVGLAGLIFLAIVFFYLVKTPVGIEEGGQTYGPGDYDKKVLRDEAERLQSTLRRRPEPLPPAPEYAGDFVAVQRDPLRVAGVADSQILLAPWRLPVPPAFGNRPVEAGQIRLATIIAPSAPLAYGGKTTFYLRPARAINATDEEKTEEQQELLARLEQEVDRSWVTVAAVFDLEAQRKEFRKSHYDRDLQDIWIAAVDVQRQQLSAFGEWSEWQTIEPWTEYQRLAAPKISLSRKGETWILAPEVEAPLNAYRDLVIAYQPELRQPYPPEDIGGDRWRLPNLANINWDLLDVDPSTQDPEATNEYLASLPRPEVKTAAGSAERKSEAERAREERIEAARKLKRAEELAESENLVVLNQAADLCVEIRKSKNAVKAVKDKAEKLLAKLELRIQEKELEQARAEAETLTKQPARADVLPTLAPTQAQTVVWAHDLTMRPGHTYRYRMRVGLFNRYVGNFEKLREQDPATQVLVWGQWSEPSDPIEVLPDIEFFVASARPDEAKVDLYMWVRGYVANRKLTVPVGGRIALQDFVKLPRKVGDRNRIPVNFDTGYTLLAAHPDRPVQTLQGGKGLAFRETTTPIVVCVDASGQIVERSKAADGERLKQWAALYKERKADE